MKKVVVALVILALAGLMLLAAWAFGGPDYGLGYTLPSQEQSTETSTEEEETEATTEEPTQPPVVLLERSESLYVNGIQLQAYVQEGDDVLIVPGNQYLLALGLGETGSAHASDKAAIKLSDDGRSLQLGEKTYSTNLNGTFYLPVYEFAEDFGYPVWVDDDNGDIYITPGAERFEMSAEVDVPVLMYHAVSDDCWGIRELFVRPSVLEEQLKFLVENGYDPIWFEDLAHLEDYDKPVILTFDDGYDDNYTELFPLLKKYNVKITLFVIARDTEGANHKLNKEQIREMSDSGLVSVQSHGYSHDYMDRMSREELDYELGESKRIISRITGKVPYVLCYPTGKYNNTTLEMVPEYYNFALKMVGGMYNTGDDPFRVNRYYISRETGLRTFESYIADAGQ